MESFKKIINRNTDAITKSDKTLKDIYSVMFSNGDRIAYERLVDYEIDEMTYNEHDLIIRTFASYIKHHYPDTSDEYIGIDISNSPDFLTAFWGILMSGNKPYLINSFYPLDLRTKILKRLNVNIVITSTPDYIDFTNINIDSFDENCPQIADDFWHNEFAISSTLTGLESKICVFDGEAVVNQILNAKSIIKTNNWFRKTYKKRIKVAMILPLFHIFGIMVSYFWFSFFGATMVFHRDNSPDTIRGTINRHKVTHIFAPPIFFHKLYKGIMSGISQESEKRKKKFHMGVKLAFILQNIFPSPGVLISKKLFKEVLTASFGISPMLMISGGAHIDSEALRIINCIGYPLLNGYGTTETAISGVNLAKKIRLRTNGSIGDSFKSVSYTFDDDGTLIVSGDSICKQIITMDGETSGFDSIKTNDIVKIVDGQYFITGRKSDLYIGENGENISPDIIQNELKVKNANRFCVLELNKKLSIVLEYSENLPRAIISNEIEKLKESLTEITYGQFISDIFIVHQPIANPNAIKVSRALLQRRVGEGSIVLIDHKNIFDGEKKQNDSVDDVTMSSIKEAFKVAANTDEEIQSATDFFIDLDGTSLDYIMLICDLESTFNIQINLEKNQNLRTPENFYNHLMEVL